MRGDSRRQRITLGAALVMAAVVGFSVAPDGRARAGEAPPAIDRVAVPAVADESAVRGTAVELVPPPRHYPGCESRRVFTVGDSLTAGIVNLGGGYHSMLRAAGYTPTSVYEVGRFTLWGVGQLRLALGSGQVGGLVVMALGTNDAYKTPPSYLAAFKLRVDEAMRLAGPDRTVIWVNLQMGKPGTATDPELLAMAEPFNTVLQEKASVWPNLVVVDWASTPNRQYLGSDQMHYSTIGYRNRAAAIVDAITSVSC